MPPAIVFAILLGLVVLATALGLLWRATTGRAVTGDLTVVSLPEIPPARATLLQLSTAVCAPCVPTRSLLARIAAERSGVQHVDIDLTDRADLAARFAVLQTPTTLVLDARGAIRARIGGAPRPAEVSEALDRILLASKADAR